MSVSDRKREKSSGFSQMLRTFFQSYDEANPPDRIQALRELPLGPVASFFIEQGLWRTQRTIFGITLVEVRRGIELAREELGALRNSFSELEKEINHIRELSREQA